MKSSTEIKRIAKDTVALEANSIKNLENSINDDFVAVIDLIMKSTGRLIVAGIGKSANIANKMVATFNSTGQPALFLHAADAVHGDLGNVQKGDIVLCISKSGNTAEIKAILPIIKNNIGDSWDGLSNNAKGAIMSITYNYGKVPKRIRAAINTGNTEKISAAIRSLAKDNDGINKNRRLAEAELVMLPDFNSDSLMERRNK